MKVKSFANDQYGNQRDIFIEHVFDKGEYIVMVNIEWLQSVHSEVVISSYSEYPIKFDEQSLRFID